MAPSLQAYLSDGDPEYLMVVETCGKGAILDMQDTSKANYFATGKEKNLICRVFIESKMILFCMYAGFLVIYSQIIFYSCLI